MKKQLRTNGIPEIVTQVVDLKLVAALSPDECEQKRKCEETIRNHLKSFFECASALKHIHDNKLYRADFDTFETYARLTWGYSRAYALRLVKAADYVENILLPMGDVPLPENESQVRPITLLPPEQARKAWHQVARRAKNKAISAALVTDVVREFQRTHTQKGEILSSTQKSLQKLLGLAVKAIKLSNFIEAQQHITAAQIRIDIEAAKLHRTT